MGSTLDQIRELIRLRSVRVSEHGYDELAGDGILAREAIEGFSTAILVEDYPDYPKGARVWCEKQSMKNNTYTSSGEYQKAKPNRQF